jgi:hypothetical protein
MLASSALLPNSPNAAAPAVANVMNDAMGFARTAADRAFIDVTAPAIAAPNRPMPAIAAFAPIAARATAAPLTAFASTWPATLAPCIAAAFPLRTFNASRPVSAIAFNAAESPFLPASRKNRSLASVSLSSESPSVPTVAAALRAESPPAVCSDLSSSTTAWRSRTSVVSSWSNSRPTSAVASESVIPDAARLSTARPKSRGCTSSSCRLSALIVSTARSGPFTGSARRENTSARPVPATRAGMPACCRRASAAVTVSSEMPSSRPAGPTRASESARLATGDFVESAARFSTSPMRAASLMVSPNCAMVCTTVSPAVPSDRSPERARSLTAGSAAIACSALAPDFARLISVCVASLNENRVLAEILSADARSPEVEAAVLRVRKAHPTWGSKKILAVLDRERPDESWPARSTIDSILKHAGVVEPRERRLRRQPSGPPFVEAAAANDVWSMDYKGWFLVGDGTRCDPLTINDTFSRVSIVCHAMVAPKLDDVRRHLQRTFGAYGMPKFMLSDSGPRLGRAGSGACRGSASGSSAWVSCRC